MISVKDLFEQAENMKGFFVAALTDEYAVDTWPLTHRSPSYFLDREEKVLEIRIFDREREYKLFRGDAGRTFRLRERDDSTEYMEEKQYLDINLKRSEKLFEDSHEVCTESGDGYYLPLPAKAGAKAVIHYYFERNPETGQAGICDWRMVAFEEGDA